MAVAEAPAWGLLGLFAAFTFITMSAMDPLWRNTLGAAFRKLAGIGFGGVHGIGSVHPLGFLRSVDTAVMRWIENGKSGAERTMVYSFNKMIDTAALLFGVPLAIALALYELAHYVAHLTGKVVTRAEHTTVVKKVTTITKATGAITRVQFNKLTHRVDALAHRVARLGHVSAGAIAAPFPRIGRLEKTAKAQAKRISKLEKVLAGGLGVALLVKALSRLGLGWLRCGNVTKAGKSVCRMNPSMLEALLLDAATLTVAFNLEEFARELQTVTGEAARLIHNLAD